MPTAGLITGPAVISHQKGMSPMSRCVRCRSHLRSQGGTQGYLAFSVNDRRWYFLDCLTDTTEAGWTKTHLEKGVHLSLGCQNKRL